MVVILLLLDCRRHKSRRDVKLTAVGGNTLHPAGFPRLRLNHACAAGHILLYASLEDPRLSSRIASASCSRLQRVGESTSAGARWRRHWQLGGQPMERQASHINLVLGRETSMASVLSVTNIMELGTLTTPAPRRGMGRTTCEWQQLGSTTYSYYHQYDSTLWTASCCAGSCCCCCCCNASCWLFSFVA